MNGTEPSLSLRAYPNPNTLKRFRAALFAHAKRREFAAKIQSGFAVTLDKMDDRRRSTAEGTFGWRVAVRHDEQGGQEAMCMYFSEFLGHYHRSAD